MKGTYSCCQTWSATRSEVQKDLQSYWSFRGKIYSNRWHCYESQKNKNTYSATRQVSKTAILEAHGNREDKDAGMCSIYCMNINDDIEEMIKNCPTCLEFQATCLKIRQWDMKHQGGHLGLYIMTYLTLITSIIFVL